MPWTPQEKKRIKRIENRLAHAGFPVTDEPEPADEPDDPPATEDKKD